MRLIPRLALVALLATPALAAAGTNRNYLVPVYEPCQAVANCNPPKRTSSYTFDSVTLSSSQSRYTGPNRFAIGVTIKGLKDAAGSPVNGSVELRVEAGRVTLLDGVIGTLVDNSPLAAVSPYRVEVKNGNGSKRFTTPDSTPERGFVVNTLASPVLLDPEGKPLATTGTQAKP